MRVHSSILAIVVFITSCATSPPAADVKDSEYVKAIESWHQTRNERLNQPTGWLTLSGLFWLEEGDNRFGSNNENQLVFPGEDVPGIMGVLHLIGESVSISVADGIQIFINDTLRVSDDLRKDSDGDPDILTWNNLSWYIIKRGDRIGVRLRDSQHPNFINFKPTKLFPIDSNWKITARLETFDTVRTVDIVNVLGDTSPGSTPGILHFDINDQSFTLTPLADPGDKNYFIIFGDATNGLSTYGAGRFLVIPAADETGNTYIDFNKSYNMPCAFSPYATCPLPPEENQLPIAVEAGELDYLLDSGH